MATEIRVPTLGESVSEATIAKWFKKPGDAVKADETLVGTRDRQGGRWKFRLPPRDVLGTIAAKEGESVGGQRVLGYLEAAGAAAAAKPAEAPKAAAPAPAAPAAAMPAAPAAAKLMAESGVSVDAGSGKRGKVLKEDVMAAIANAAIPAPLSRCAGGSRPVARSTVEAPREERVRMTKLRQTIARRLKDAQNTAAMLSTFNEVDMSSVMALRNSYKDVFEKRHGV